MVTGIVVAFAGEKIPDGWLLCDGRSLDKNDGKYKALFEAVGTIHGGDGNPNFNLPDYRGMFLRGVDRGVGRDPDAAMRVAPGMGNTGNSGDRVGSVQEGQVQRHGHSVGPLKVGHSNGGNGHPHRIMSDDGRSWNGYEGQLSADPFGGSETRPRNVYVNYIIKL